MEEEEERESRGRVLVKERRRGREMKEEVDWKKRAQREGSRERRRSAGGEGWH